MVSVSYHASIKDLQGLRSIEALVHCGPFTRAGWYSLMDEYNPLAIYVMARDHTGAVILPLIRGSQGLQSLTNSYSFSWQPLMTLGANVPKLLEAALNDLGQNTGELHLSKLPQDNGWSDYLQKALAATHWVVSTGASDTNHYYSPQGKGYDAYYASLSSRLQDTITTKAKALETRITTEFSDRAWTDFEDVYRDSWKASDTDPSMMRYFAKREGREGRLLLGFALHSGVPVAAQFWTVEEGIAYIHLLAFREQSRHLSPGTVLTAAMMEQVLDNEQVSLVDFGSQNDPSKRHWINTSQPQMQMTAWRKERPSNWPVIIKSRLRALVP